MLTILVTAICPLVITMCALAILFYYSADTGNNKNSIQVIVIITIMVASALLITSVYEINGLPILDWRLLDPGNQVNIAWVGQAAKSDDGFDCVIEFTGGEKRFIVTKEPVKVGPAMIIIGQNGNKVFKNTAEIANPTPTEGEK